MRVHLRPNRCESPARFPWESTPHVARIETTQVKHHSIDLAHLPYHMFGESW